MDLMDVHGAHSISMPLNAVSFSSVVSKAEHFLLLGDAAKSLHKRGRP